MRRNASTWLVTVLVAAAAWWALLGWDTERYRVGDQIEGPYSGGQVAAFVVVLAAIAVWTGVRRSPLVSSFLLAVVTGADVAISGRMIPTEEPSFWPLGAIFAFIGCLAGATAISSATAAVVVRR